MSKSRSVFVRLILLSLLAAAAQAATLPRPAPEFRIDLPGGKSALLSQYKGKTVALIFILTYCPHCQTIVTFLSKDQNEYGPKGFQVLASAIENEAAAAVPEFLKKFNPPFPVGSNVRPPVLDFLQHPIAERLLMPQMVFIDRQGVIRAQYSGDSKFLDPAQADQNLRGEIEELLKEGATKKGAPKAGKK